MNNHDQKPGGRRIVVGLTAASDADRTIAAAAVLAGVTEAKIVGLFMQEEIMFELAEFPFARVLNFDSPAPREFSRQSMQEAFARTAAVCRRVLSKRAGKAQVNWSFSTKQGDLSAAFEAMAGSGDYVVLPGETHGMGTRTLIHTLRMVPAGVGGVVVAALHRKSRSTGPIVAIDDGDETGARTIVLAARLAALEDRPLHLIVIAATDADAERIEARAATLVSGKQTMTTHRHLPGSPQSIAASLIHLSPFFVVGDLDGEPFSDDQIAVSLFRAAKAPVLLLRKA